MNLEKARVLDEAKTVEGLVRKAEGKIESEVKLLGKKLEQMKKDMRLALRNFIGCVVGLFGVYEFVTYYRANGNGTATPVAGSVHSTAVTNSASSSSTGGGELYT